MPKDALFGRGGISELGKSGDLQDSVTVATKGVVPRVTKVSAVLSTSYSDADFRATVNLIDDRGIKNDGKTRRRLRLELQKEVIERNGQVLDVFSSVSEQLKRIKSTLDKINYGYIKMKSQVATAHGETDQTLKEASLLLENRQDIERRRLLVQSLRDRFVLSEAEELTLTSTIEPVDDNFFAALARAKKISQECEVLLGFEKQTLASEIMEKASKNIGFGYQKLYKWVQREFKHLDLENPQMNATMRKALTVLAARPSLFQSCLDFFAEARQRILSDTFFATLTGNNTDGNAATVKPIDLIAHDALRYVGDMLAWVHSAAVSEKEVLEGLFVVDGEELARGINSGRDADLWRIISDGDDEEFNTLKALNDLVDRDISGAARILRQRVEQVIQSNEDSILAYKLANLVRFYTVMFLKLLGPDCSLLQLVNGLEKEAMRQFRTLLREQIAAVRAEPQHIPSDFGPPVFLQAALKQIEDMLGTYESSLSNSASDGGGIDQVLVEAIDPFILDCEALGKSMSSPLKSIYLINCRSAVAKCFKRSDMTREREKQLQLSIKDEAVALTDSQLEFFLDGSGLSDVIAALKLPGQSETTVITPSKLSTASSELDHFLPSAYIDALERLGKLQDSSLARGITEAAAERFCIDFELLEKHIDLVDATKNDENRKLRNVFPRTASEIRVLLS